MTRLSWRSSNAIAEPADRLAASASSEGFKLRCDDAQLGDESLLLLHAGGGVEARAQVLAALDEFFDALRALPCFCARDLLWRFAEAVGWVAHKATAAVFVLRTRGVVAIAFLARGERQHRRESSREYSHA